MGQQGTIYTNYRSFFFEFLVTANWRQAET